MRDIRCQNGVIHEIDTLLVPNGPSLPPLIPTAVAPASPAAGTAPASTNAPPEVDLLRRDAACRYDKCAANSGIVSEPTFTSVGTNPL